MTLCNLDKIGKKNVKRIRLQIQYEFSLQRFKNLYLQDLCYIILI